VSEIAQSTAVQTVCRACESRGEFAPVQVREMMYGSRDTFDYVECTACGSVQIARIPESETLAAYYPSDYYSFQEGGASPWRARARRWLETRRDYVVAGRRSLVGSVLVRRLPSPLLETVLASGIRPDHRILDVGCGSGQLLDRLARLGYRNLLGADPFIPHDLRSPSGVEIRKNFVHEVDGTFDVIMFNHSLEHVADPAQDLRHAAERLAPGGLLVVRLPTSGTMAWRTYRENWVQLDPPRHLVIPSRDGMAHLARRAGLDIVGTVDDSSSFQFVVSELYQRDISYYVPGTTDPTPEIGALFPAHRMAELEDEARALNARGDGDQAMFLMRAAG
jgi:SAM-dependent methyltransferase